jgi:hypothetical protein
VRSTLPRALYLDMARLTTRGLTRGRLLGMRLARTSLPIVPARPARGCGPAPARPRCRYPARHTRRNSSPSVTAVHHRGYLATLYGC